MKSLVTLKGTPTLIVGKHREDVKTLFDMIMVEAEIIDVTKRKVLVGTSHWVLSVLLKVLRESRYSFAAVAAIDQVGATG
jgi:hypothetical protein